MLTPGLERLIQKGLATQNTFVFGAGGVGRIPVPQNTFIIIHHFDYWHFLDLPPVAPEAPSQAQVSWYCDPGQGPFPVNLDFGIIGNGITSYDYDDLPTTLANVTAIWTAIMPGGSVIPGFDPGTGLVSYTFITTSPGNIWNGQPATQGFGGIIPPTNLQLFNAVFAGGESGTMSHEALLTHHTHQLEFRSKKSRDHFVIQEPVVLFPIQASPPPIGPDVFFVWMNGTTYQKDCYLIHAEPVKINVLGVPDVDQWSTVYSQLAVQSQEDKLPVGYGIGVAGLNTVRQVLFNPAGAPADIEQYLPLSKEFESIAPVVGSYRNQFKVDANTQNALFDPKNKGGVYGNFPTYPLINIDYIHVNMNYNEYVKATS